ncbi:asparagine synthase-related protein [Streptomyces kunmingensis]|uniref:Asparagine synthase-related protein n=1 Tax=Streptomyces kunmingensis TaxID=68225 RepID=A0ABU6CPS5_9ACTN|nr:asparagine synthase-related protein [Streptomyces kunmingensis]MEB3966216.1 asparagine synthase-related protein [Streptomyces kunmingensis]
MSGRPAPPAPPHHERDCFVVLPDTDAGRAAAGPLLRRDGHGPGGVQVFRYPSGRPWLLVRTPLRRVSAATAGPDRAVVLIGPDAIPESELAADLRAARDDAGLHGRLARRLPGLHHVISRTSHTGKETWVRGTASGLRRVYVTTGSGPRLISDRPGVLARLTGAALDEAALALRLLDFLPHPLGARPVWHGITETNPAYALVLRADGTSTTRRWWHAPGAELPLSEGASHLADALDRSVRAHLAGRSRISCELSGGLDSTSLTFLARRTQPERLALLTVASRERHAEDETWARHAAELARAETGPDPESGPARLTHDIVPADEAPLFYAGVSTPAAPGDALTDEPLPVAPARARARLLLARAAAAGSECHLTGYGGDELFMGLPAASGDLFPRHPLAAWNRIGAVRHQLGWPLAATTRALLTRPSFARWLAGAVTDEAAPTARTPQLSWGVRQTLPPWLTPDARALVRSAFRSAAAEGAEPLAPRPGRHLDLDTVHIGARHFQAMETYGLGLGLPVAAPLYADHVIEATLAVRLADRIDPARYKPLLAEAVRDTVPAPLLARTTKDHMNGDHTQGLVQHADELRELWDAGASRLAALGLVDVRQLDALAADPYSPLHTRHSIDSAVACEMWLRAAAPAHREALTP